MRKEENLLRKVGTQNPFRVPDRYFEDFTQQLMSNLPEKESASYMPEVTLWQRIKPWLYMTAMFCGIMLSVRIFVGPTHQAPFPIKPPRAAWSRAATSFIPGKNIREKQT